MLPTKRGKHIFFRYKCLKFCRINCIYVNIYVIWVKAMHLSMYTHICTAIHVYIHILGKKPKKISTHSLNTQASLIKVHPKYS